MFFTDYLISKSAFSKKLVSASLLICGTVKQSLNKILIDFMINDVSGSASYIMSLNSLSMLGRYRKSYL
jgi:hypothetical protein